MKKAYMKPDISLEIFQISDAVASGCTFKVLYSADSCEIQDPGMIGEILFSSKNDSCTSKWDDGDNKGCYHVPTGEHPSYFFCS